METLILLVQNYGYAMVFVGTLLEGETIVALAGFAAYGGHLKLSLVIPIAIVGAIVGDQSLFYLGRYKGKQLLERYPNLKKRVERVHQLTERYHGWIIFGSRFMYGFRVIIPISFGLSGINAVKFFLLNLLGAIVWAPIFALGGYAFGNAIQLFLGNVRRFEEIVVIGAFTLIIIVKVVLYVREKHVE